MAKSSPFRNEPVVTTYRSLAANAGWVVLLAGFINM